MSVLVRYRYMCRLLQKLPVYLYNSSKALNKCPQTLHRFSACISLRCVHDYNETENVEEEAEPIAALYEETPPFVRNALYPESKDPIINNLVQCTSIQQVLDIVKANSNRLSNEQVTQTVATFWDLIKVLFYLNGMPETKENVKSNYVVMELHNNAEFQSLLNVIETNIDDFFAIDLSYVHLYLIKLGLDENHNTLKLITDNLKSKLMKEFSLASASRFITGCFSDYNLKSHFHVQPFIPFILNDLDNCHTPDDIKHFTICISSAHAFLSKEMLEKYKLKISQMIDNSSLRPEDYKVILKILTFLTNPVQRDDNIDLIRKCMVLVKRKISEMNASEVCVLSEIFHTTQESAIILNDIQRNATKHFLQMEEEVNPNMYLRLKLLSVLILIATPHQRHQYHNTVLNYAKENLHQDALFVLRKILSDIKTSDIGLSNRLWDQIRRLVVKSNDRNLLKLVSEYANFNVDIANYRHVKFENVLTLMIDRELNQGVFYHMPSILAHVSLLYIPYSNNRRKVEKIVNKLCECWAQLTSVDWLKISKAVQTAKEVTNNQILERDHCFKIKKACDAYVLKNIGNLSLSSITLLLKSYILREEVNSRLVDYLLIAVSASPQMSSNLMKNTVYCFRNTHSYSLDVLDKMSNYICENYSHLLGTTIEKYLFLCYYANHLPKNPEKLFQVVTDVLIRDTERMNGLTYLQASLALCFFNRLPQSFIKHIFNVSFLEKLDSELAACYAKETYPLRVRHLMMQLNRAVCLEYPEANIPWFHEKYVQERKRADRRRPNYENVFYLQVYESLLEIAGNPGFILKNIVAPYGYSVDFVVALNKRNEITDPLNGVASTQIAFILPKSKAYLRFDSQLMGKYAFKRRHLEILGYKVVFIKWRDWWSLTTNKNRVDYVKSTIWPDKVEMYASTSDR